LVFSSLFQWPNSSAAASDTLSAGESLTGNRTLVSAGGMFELGFFSPAGNSNYYVGIWYKQIPGRTVVWVMNRDSPVADPSSSELTLAQDGSLALLTGGDGNGSRESIWSSNSTGSRDDDTAAAVAAVLLDTGNLVLHGRSGGNSSAIVWQSFDHPTDTLVPGGWVGLNKRAKRCGRGGAPPDRPVDGAVHGPYRPVRVGPVRLPVERHGHLPLRRGLERADLRPHPREPRWACPTSTPSSSSTTATT